MERWPEREAAWVMAGERTRIGLWRPQVGLAGGRGGIHVHYALALHSRQTPLRWREPLFRQEVSSCSGTAVLLAATRGSSAALRISSLSATRQRSLDARVSATQHQLDTRITAEKYVAGVYLLFVAVFLAYMLIHSQKIKRLEEELARTLDAIVAS